MMVRLRTTKRELRCSSKFGVLFGVLSMLLPSFVVAQESQCFGQSANGRLENGVKLPISGENYESYSRVASLAGRTYVHSKVRDILLDSYEMLQYDHPAFKFKYGETGFADGGQFKPHKTHQNGTSVDFFTPMKDARGKPALLPTHAFNKLGYAIELDADGRWRGMEIDYFALAAHLAALQKAAQQHGVKITRVTFAPSLQPPLFASVLAGQLPPREVFTTRAAWVRHDEHIMLISAWCVSRSEVCEQSLPSYRLPTIPHRQTANEAENKAQSYAFNIIVFVKA